MFIAFSDNFPPTIEADSLFRIDIGIEAEYSLTVEDQTDSFTLTIQGGLPQNSDLISLEDGAYIFRWNLQEPTTNPLVFVAIDSQGAASTFVPKVEVCACVNGGVCTEDGLLTTNSTVVLNCQCTEGRFNILSCFTGIVVCSIL